IINAHYDPVTEELTYHLKLDKDFAWSTPLAFDLNLAPFASFGTSSTLAVSGNATIEFTFGLSLAPTRAALLGPAADATVPAVLKGDAHFQLTVGDNVPVDVTVSRQATIDNANLDDLAADINTALQAAGLEASVRAVRKGSQIALTTVGAAGPSLQIHVASPDDPAATDLGFEDGQEAHAQAGDLFIQDASIHGDLSVAVNNIVAAARLGFVEIQVGQGSQAQGQGTIDVTLK